MTETASTAAPADRQPHSRWPLWRKIAAYLVLAVLAVASIWFINRRVDRIANLPAALKL